MAITPIVLGIGIFAAFTARIFISWITLPPFSIEVEGQYVGFSLLLLMYAYALPVTCSLCLAGYLIYPPMFHQFRTPINLLAGFFTVVGIAALVILPMYALLRNISVVIAALGFMAPYITVPLLAYTVYKASRTHKKTTDIEFTQSELKNGQTSGILALLGGGIMIAAQFPTITMIIMRSIMLPTYPPAVQPSMFESTLFMLLFAAIPIAIGIVVFISGMLIYQGDLKTGGLLALVFAIQSFSTFGVSLILGAILVVIGGLLAYFSKDNEYGA